MPMLSPEYVQGATPSLADLSRYLPKADTYTDVTAVYFTGQAVDLY